jgi:nucleoside-diphosphate-sugar epimerase
MKILVTGGGGFLGTWIIKELLKNPSYMITNMSRHKYTHLEDLAVPTMQGDITKLEDVERVLREGFDVVFHVASLVGMWGRKEVFDAINITGTQNLLEVSKRMGVKRFIYTGSPSSVFGRGGHAGADETLPYPDVHLGHYPRTKAIAEKMVLDANSVEMKTVSLRPHLVWGPGDLNLLPRVINQARVGKLKMIGNGDNQVDVIYVEEAARAHVLAMHALEGEAVAAGRAYFLGQGPVRLWDFIEKVLKYAEIDPPQASVSLGMAQFLGWMFEKLWTILGIFSPEPPVTRFVALNMGTDHWFSHERAEKDLGWKAQITIDEGLERLFGEKKKIKLEVQSLALSHNSTQATQSKN